MWSVWVFSFGGLASSCRSTRTGVLNAEPGRGEGNSLKATAQEAAILLEASGAEVRWTRNIHNKNLLVDDSTVVLGGFNWLSARRHESDRYHRFDSSIRFQGPQAKEWIEQFEREMEARVIVGN